MKNIIGKTVLLERMDEKGAALDYNSGEYLVVNQTPMTLYCCKLGTDSVYAIHSLTSFLVEGTRAWKVVKEYDNDKEFIKTFIQSIEQRIVNEMAAEKRQWVESVYSSASANLLILKRKLKLIVEPTTSVTKDSTITITIGIRNGKLVIV